MFYLIIHQLIPENRAVFEIMWKNIEKKYKPQKIIKYDIRHCMLDITNRYSELVTFISFHL